MGVLDSSALQMLLWWWLLKNWLLWATVPFLYPWVVSWIPSPGIERNLLQKVLQEMFCRKCFAENVLHDVLQKSFAGKPSHKCFAKILQNVLQKMFCKNVLQKMFCIMFCKKVLQESLHRNVLQKCFAKSFAENVLQKMFRRKCFAKMFCRKCFAKMFCRKSFAENVLHNVLQKSFAGKPLQKCFAKSFAKISLSQGSFPETVFFFFHFQEGSFIFKHKIKKYFFSLGSSLSVSSTVWWQKSPGRWSGVSLAPARKC